jgi:hypothetical protein
MSEAYPLGSIDPFIRASQGRQGSCTNRVTCATRSSVRRCWFLQPRAARYNSSRSLNKRPAPRVVHPSGHAPNGSVIATCNLRRLEFYSIRPADSAKEVSTLKIVMSSKSERTPCQPAPKGKPQKMILSANWSWRLDVATAVRTPAVPESAPLEP